jgi:hypothetical protein
VAGPQVRGGGRPVQPQRLAARGPDLGGRGGALQQGSGGGVSGVGGVGVGGQRGGLFVALLYRDRRR